MSKYLKTLDILCKVDGGHPGGLPEGLLFPGDPHKVGDNICAPGSSPGTVNMVPDCLDCSLTFSADSYLCKKCNDLWKDSLHKSAKPAANSNSRSMTFSGAAGKVIDLEKAAFSVLQNRHTFSPVRVIVSPVLSAKFGSTGQFQSDWKST